MFRMRNQIKLSQLQPHPQNPRKHLDSDELIDSIRETGLLSPLLVRRIGFEKFQIISGHRRKLALERMGENYADCDLVEMNDEQAYKALMTANIQSHSLSEIEEAEGIKHMLDAYEWTQERVAKEFGKSQDWISLRLKLLAVAEPVKELLTTRVVSAGQVRHIAQLPVEKQTEVAERVVSEDLSVRETAELVRQIKNPDIQVRPTECEIQTESTDEIRLLETEVNVTNPQFLGKSLPSMPTRNVSNRIRASDYITKFYEFLANLDDETIDGVIELDETDHLLAVIDKAQEQLNWMRSKVTKAGETNIVEFRRKEA